MLWCDRGSRVFMRWLVLSVFEVYVFVFGTEALCQSSASFGDRRLEPGKC